MRDFSQRGGRGGLASLLSCPAPGRPLYLEGEAARPSLTPIDQTSSSVYHPFRGWEAGPSVPYPTRTNKPNFLVLRLGEVRRICLLRTRVNRPQEGGRRKCGGVSVLRYSSSSGVEARPSISLRCGWRPKRAIT